MGHLKLFTLVSLSAFSFLNGSQISAQVKTKLADQTGGSGAQKSSKKAKERKFQLQAQSESFPSTQSQEHDTSKHVKPNFSISYKLNGFGGKHEKKMREALGRLKWVVRSEAFKQKVLNHTYKGQKGFYQNKGYSNFQIYQKLLKGAEDLNPIEDNKMNLKMTLYYSQTNTVGYTYPNTDEIWVNRKYFEKYTLGEVANNAMHEWLHKIGFEHSYYNNADRPYTVPYAIGEIVEEIINGLN